MLSKSKIYGGAVPCILDLVCNVFFHSLCALFLFRIIFFLFSNMFLTLIILFAGFFFSYSRYNSLYGKKKLKSNAIKEEEEEEDDGDDNDEKDDEDANISETLHTIFKTDKFCVKLNRTKSSELFSPKSVPGVVETNSCSKSLRQNSSDRTELSGSFA